MAVARLGLVGPAPDLRASSDSGVSDADNTTNDNTPTFDVARPDPRVPYYRLLRDGVPAGGGYEFGSSATAAPQADGASDYTIRYVDLAGNASPTSRPLRVTIDTSAPQAVPPVPDLRAESDSGISNTDDITNDNTPTVRVAPFLPAPYYRLYQDGAAVTGPYATATEFTPAALADGAHDFSLALVDAAGNQSAPGPALRVAVDTTAPTSSQVAGTIDLAFSAADRFTYEDADQDLIYTGTLAEPDGAMLVSAYAGSPGRWTTLVMRIRPDGTPDPAYGTSGRVLIPGFAGSVVRGGGGDGSVLVSGGGRIARLLPGGVPDPAFGDDGVVELPVGAGDLATVAPDGKIVLAWYTPHPVNGDYGVSRLNPDGTPDPSFAGGGAARLPAGLLDVYGVAVAADGKVVLAAQTGNWESQTAVVVRYNADGTLDTAFANRGVFASRQRLGGGYARVVLPQADGTTLVGGEGSAGGFVLRLTPGGTIDNTFGSGGVRFADRLQGISAAVRLPGGGFVFGAAAKAPGFGFFAIDDHGNLDARFGDGGQSAAAPALYGGVTDLALSPGKGLLVAGGAAYTGVFVFRLHGATSGLAYLDPGSDTGVSKADHVTNDNTPTFDLAVADDPGPGGTYARLYRGGGTRVSGPYQSDGPYTAGPQPDGVWAYALRLVDAAGNESDPGPGRSVTIDTVAPRVEDVLVGSSTWSPSFLAYLKGKGLGDGGYSVARPGGQAAGVPWVKMDRVTVRLSEPLALPRPLTATDLLVAGVRTPRYNPSSVEHNPAADRVVWHSNGPPVMDRLLLAFPGPASPNVPFVDAAGNAMAGLSGRVDLLPGDAGLDRRVNATDLLMVRRRMGRSAANPGGSANGYSPFADINGDGAVNTFDMLLVRTRFGQTLPAAQPIAPTAVPVGMFASARISARERWDEEAAAVLT